MDEDKPAQDARIRDSFWPDRRQPDHETRAGVCQAVEDSERKIARFERLTRWMGWAFVAMAALLIGAHLVARLIQGAPT